MADFTASGNRQPCHDLAIGDVPWISGKGGKQMRRDDELLRRMMQEFEASPDFLHDHDGFLEEASEEEQREYWHLRSAVDAGLLEEMSQGTFRMTWSGHDWVGVSRNDTVWAKAKEEAGKVPGSTVALIGKIGVEMIREIIMANLKRSMGLD